jgi:hypothetical protein
VGNDVDVLYVEIKLVVGFSFISDINRAKFYTLPSPAYAANFYML